MGKNLMNYPDACGEKTTRVGIRVIRNDIGTLILLALFNHDTLG